MAYIHGTSRYQVEAQFLSLEEIIDNFNPVRVIDAYVNSLDLSSLGLMNIHHQVLVKDHMTEKIY